MRVLCLSLSALDKVGGIQTFNKFFYDALKENKIQYSIISLHDTNKQGSHIYGCNSNYLKFLYFLIKLSNSNTINVWQHVTLTTFLPILNVLKKTKSNILTLYGTEIWGKKLSIFKKIGLMKTDQLWCISNFTAKQVSQKFNIEENKLKILPCCINYNKENFYYKNPYKKKYNILTILRLDKSKKLNAVFEMLKALSEIKKHNKNIHFTIIGDGNYKNKISKVIKDYNLQKEVSLLGFVSNTNPYLQHCDVFTLTSPIEGFGIVYLEAMQYKKVCISSTNCGSEDVVLNNKTGYSVEPNDIKGLIKVICEIISNKKYSEKLGKNGYYHFVQNFTFSKFKKNQLRLLKGVKSEL